MNATQSDRTREILIDQDRAIIPKWATGEEMDIHLRSDEVRSIRLYSDIEALGGIYAARRPTQGVGVYPKTQFTQSIYLALEIHCKDQGKILIPRQVEKGLVDCFYLAEELEEKMGLSYEHIDDYTGRSFATNGAVFLLIATLIGLIFG